MRALNLGHHFVHRRLPAITHGLLVLLIIGFQLPASVAAQSPLPGGTLDPTLIPKYVDPLVIPPAMPRTTTQESQGALDYYEIAVRQFRQQILPSGFITMPVTTVWSYGSVNHPGSFNYPAFTIEATTARPVRVKWINDLKDEAGNFLPHLLPVDPTLHWANPPGGPTARDSEPTFSTTPDAYRGPVPMVSHLHGGHNTQESDGYPEAWFLPAARNIPSSFATVGSFYEAFRQEFRARWGVDWEPGSAVFQYANEQLPATLWYHDHTLGMTRLNVYAGPAGFYLLRGGPEDLPAGALPGPAPRLGDAPGTKYYEIPIAIQDRSFNADGSLFYPDTREFFDEFPGPYIPESDINPIWNPEFFGNTMVVNGRTWPFLQVEQRRYRFRLLNGSDSRFLILKLSNGQPFWQIGADGGFLPAPVQLDQLLLGPAERADVIVDFSAIPAGSRIILQNLGPDEPFGGGVPDEDFPAADPATTGQVMQFRVVPPVSADTTIPPDRLTLPPFRHLGAATNTRLVSLNEDDSLVLEDVGPREAMLGIVDADSAARHLEWKEVVTENPALGATETWEIHNFTADAHPIHIHEVQFSVVDRQPFGGTARPPESWEAGFKDTVIAFPGEITRVKALFDLPGQFVWHCHILEHEDNEMMRPYVIGAKPEALTVERRVTVDGDVETVDISVTNNTSEGLSDFEIRALLPPGAALAAASPSQVLVAGNELVWFNSTLLQPGERLSGFQYKFRGTGNPVVTVHFVGGARGTASTQPDVTPSHSS